MAIANSLEKVSSAARTEGQSPLKQNGPSVFVVFTSTGWTLKALEKANAIALPQGADIHVIAAEVVPFPLQLDEPPVPMEFVIKRFVEIVGTLPGKVLVSAYLCRNLMEAFKRILNRNCTVVIGLRKTWLPNRNERLARKLHRAGYKVIRVRMEPPYA